MADTEEREQREVHYRGMVQGVGFRYTVRQIAARFAVVGYVKNLPDGRVLVVVEGRRREIQRFLDEIGVHLGRYISGTHEVSLPATGGYGEFDIRF